MRPRSLALFLPLLLPLAALAQAETSSTGGTVDGTISYEGAAPPPAAIQPHVNHEVCGARSPLSREDLLVSPRGGLANVALYLDGELPARAARPVFLDQRNCTFVPHVQTMTQGAELTIGNADPVIHNVHARLHKRTVFNLAMPLPGIKVKRKVDEPGILSITCDSGHTWMSAFVVVVPHGFHTTTDAQGRFVISGVPAGTYRLRAWHEVLGPLDQEVTVTAGQATKLRLAFRPEREVLRENQVAQAAQIEQFGTRLGELKSSLLGVLEETKGALEKAQLELVAERRKRAAALGRPLYLQHCATCHGRKGDGKGPSARFLSTMPRDFTRGEYKFRMTPSGTPPRAEDVLRTINLGVLGTEMPPWKERLGEEERRLLAEYVLSLWDRHGEEPVEAPIEIPPEPKVDADLLAKGKALYESLQCAQCHGPGGAGDGPSATTMKDSWGQPIRAADLTRGFYKGGRGAIVVHRTVATGLSGSPMPSFADLLTLEERWQLALYVASLGGERGFFERLFLDPAGRMTAP